MLLLALACTDDGAPQPLDSEPIDSEGPETGTELGQLAPPLTAEDPEGNTYTLGEGQTLVLVSTMWVPAWQDVVRDVDALYVERDGSLEAWDLLMEDIVADRPDDDDVAIWRESLGLSMPTLLGTDEHAEDWWIDQPFVVVVDEGRVTYSANQSGYDRAALERALDE